MLVDVWTYSGGGSRTIAIDKHGDIYIQVEAAPYNLEKIDSDGNKIWTHVVDYMSLNDFATDSNGYSYLVGRTPALITRIDPDGNRVQVWDDVNEEYIDWEYDLTDSKNCCVIDSNGDCICAGSGGEHVKKVDINRNKVWGLSLNFTSRGMAIDLNNNTFVGIGSTVYKILADGTQDWSYTFTDDPASAGLAVDSDGSVFSGIELNKVNKLDSSGSLEWTYTEDTAGVSTRAMAIAVNTDDLIYVGWDAQRVNKLDKSGNQIWYHVLGGSNNVRSIAVVPHVIYAGSFNDKTHKVFEAITGAFYRKTNTGWVRLQAQRLDDSGLSNEWVNHQPSRII